MIKVNDSTPHEHQKQTHTQTYTEYTQAYIHT